MSETAARFVAGLDGASIPSTSIAMARTAFVDVIATHDVRVDGALERAERALELLRRLEELPSVVPPMEVLRA